MSPCRKTRLAAAFCAVIQQGAVQAQAPPPTVLQIDTENVVQYFEDTSDVSKFATDPNVTTAVVPKNFNRALAFGDIVAVNGQRVMGTHTRDAIASIFLNTAPSLGQAIADTVRNAIGVATFEILKSDGTPIGTIVANGFSGGAPPPGAPLTVTGGGNFSITGGTGAFLGARGQLGSVAAPSGVPTARSASITEDPANRRRNGGGTQRWVVHLIPMSWPQIMSTPSGPAILHGDFSPVTATKPAKAGEVLIVQATGLGPTLPGVNPGQPFPADPLQAVNSPVAVTINGQDGEVVNSVGWPGLVDTYRVDFRVPPDASTGPAAVQVSAAWIASPAVNIPIQ